MHGNSLPGYDAWLEKPYRDADGQNVTFIADCDECGVENDVETIAYGDEAQWDCAECGQENTTYWDDDPVAGRGWIR